MRKIIEYTTISLDGVFADRSAEEARLDGAFETIAADKVETRPMREERSAR